MRRSAQTNRPGSRCAPPAVVFVLCSPHAPVFAGPHRSEPQPLLGRRRRRGRGCLHASPLLLDQRAQPLELGQSSAWRQEKPPSLQRYNRRARGIRKKLESARVRERVSKGYLAVINVRANDVLAARAGPPPKDLPKPLACPNRGQA
jgi:hypothetical protein